MRGLTLFLLLQLTTSLRISPCDSSPQQSWVLSSVGTPGRVQQSGGSPLCLATLSCAPVAEDGVALVDCTAPQCPGAVDQLWTLDTQGRLTSAASKNQLTLTLAATVGPGVNLWAAAGAVANGEWVYSGGTLTTQSAAAHHWCLGSSGGPGSIAILNASALGRPLYGIGGLAAIGGARMIYEYAEPSRSTILDLLFNASGGTAFQVLKTEMEGDMDSSYGSGSSFWHAPTEPPDFTRGIYLPWLLGEAKARVPDLGTYALAWGFPGWAANSSSSGGGDGALSPGSLAYRMSYFEGVRATYNLSFDVVGVHNERGWSRGFVKELRAALDSSGFGATRISVGDGGNSDCEDCSAAGQDTSITTAAATDPEFAAALGLIGLHSGGDDGMAALPPSYDWEGAGKDYIQSESNTVDGTFATLNGAFPQWDPNAASTYGPGLSWPRQFLLSYLHGRATGTIICPLSHAWTWGYGRHNHGTALFMRPWDGSYVLGAAFWTQAHFTQATRRGWRFLDGSATGAWDVGTVVEAVTYSTLVSPDLSQFSVIAVNVHPDSTAPLAFRLVGALAATFSGGSLAAWTSNSTSLFTRAVGQDVPISASGDFTFSLPPRTVLTLTTLRTLSKYEPLVPPRAPFPLPYTSAFATQALNTPGRLLSDLFGAFEVVVDPLGGGGGGGRGRVLQQAVPAPPVAWLGNDGTPFTSLPAPGAALANGNISADALILAGDAVVGSKERVFVAVCGRVPIWQPANYPRDQVAAPPLGLCLSLNASGGWAVVEATLTAGGTFTTHASGTLPNPERTLGSWHSLALSFVDDSATAYIDGTPVASVAPGSMHLSAGTYGLATGWHRAYFDAVHLDASAGHLPHPQSWLYDVLPGEALQGNFTGWMGFVLDLRDPATTTGGLTVAGLGRFKARGNNGTHALDIVDAATHTSVLPGGKGVIVDLSIEGCPSTDVLGFCYASLPTPVTLPVGGRYYVVSWERAGGDAVIAMSDAAAATNHAHRDGTTLMSYAGPGKGAVGGKVSQDSGSGGVWVETGDVECAFGPTNLLVM